MSINIDFKRSTGKTVHYIEIRVFSKLDSTVVYNKLETLDVSKNTALNDLICWFNQISILDLDQNKSLTWLQCDWNKLVNLDVSQNTNLDHLTCTYNQLESLNVKNGNNSILISFPAHNNLALACIQVDNAINANNGIAPYDKWQKDAVATYSEDCVI